MTNQPPPGITITAPLDCSVFVSKAGQDIAQRLGLLSLTYDETYMLGYLVTIGRSRRAPAAEDVG